MIDQEDTWDEDFEDGGEVESHPQDLDDLKEPLGQAVSSDLSVAAQVEAILFASPKALTAEEIIPLLCTGEESVLLIEVQQILESLITKFAGEDAGFQFVHVGGQAYQFQTVASAAPNMEKLFSSRPRPLSRAALETLTIIAYRQPCTRAVVEFIRGVDSGSILKISLIENLFAVLDAVKTWVGLCCLGQLRSFCRYLV